MKKIRSNTTVLCLFAAAFCIAAAFLSDQNSIPVPDPKPEPFKNLNQKSDHYLKILMDQYARKGEFTKAAEIKKILDTRNISKSD